MLATTLMELLATTIDVAFLLTKASGFVAIRERMALNCVCGQVSEQCVSSQCNDLSFISLTTFS
eukprot:scaffold16_cov190-Alexandrium_tamarense.AAC.13